MLRLSLMLMYYVIFFKYPTSNYKIKLHNIKYYNKKKKKNRIFLNNDYKYFNRLGKAYPYSLL